MMPVAKDDIATTQEDTEVTIDVLPNDSDVDGDKLSIESASVPKEQGTVEVVNGKLVSLRPRTSMATPKSLTP